MHIFGRAAAVALLLVGCSAALVPLTPEQSAGLEEAQRVADRVTRAYGVPGVRVYATTGLRPTIAAAYLRHNDWIFIRPEHLTGNGFLVVLTHELGHATLGHGRFDVPRERLSALIADHERAANRRGVEIMVRFLGVTERQALEHYATYFVAASWARKDRRVLLPFGHPLPCEQLRDLWASFGQPPPPCEAPVPETAE